MATVSFAAQGFAMENLDAKPIQSCYPIVELRQYTLHPGKRDVLIDLFDREFVESQEALGMKVIGQFRDLDNPNRFVWLRGFRDMPSRAQALKDFYGGPVWKEHREAANATMIDSSNVLLLRPATHSENTFPALPVREGENVFVWFARFNDPVAYDRHIAALTESPPWRDEISKELARRFKRAPEVLKLSPTTRSLL